MIAIPIAIGAILVLAMAAIFFTTTRSHSTGSLSRETRSRDRSSEASEAAPAVSTELESAGRERSDETRDTMSGNVPTTRRSGDLVVWEPVDEDELGVSRRQFLNRGLLTASGFSAGALGLGILGFLWPLPASGFGGKVNAGSLDEILAEIADKRVPKYVPDAKTYLQPYPASALAAGKKVYPPNIVSGMEAGVVALYQRCVHLGCRVPWCPTSQWFECPCHGSKYNAVGEKRDGPAPRGLDRFPVSVEGGRVIIDTAAPITGPRIGIDTTKQTQEGPSCV